MRSASFSVANTNLTSSLIFPPFAYTCEYAPRELHSLGRVAFTLTLREYAPRELLSLGRVARHSDIEKIVCKHPFSLYHHDFAYSRKIAPNMLYVWCDKYNTRCNTKYNIK